MVGNWSSTLSNVGIPTSTDPYGGQNHGAFVALSAINPSNWTRSYSRSAYIDPLPPRSNLDIIANALVSKINFDTSNSDNVTANGVVYEVGSTSTTVSVNKEVILAGGAVGSPHVLLLSGVGPTDVLSAAGVDTIVNLPGVGQHMMDHVSAGVSWTTTAETAAKLRDAGASDAAFLSYVNAAEAYVNITTLFGDETGQTWQQNVSNSLSQYSSSLVPSTDSTVVEGYKAIYNAIANTFMLSELGHVEILLSAQGQKGSDSQTITIQAALQHPMSQGRLYITSSNASVAPTIDPQYFSHPFDVIAFREGLKLARKIGESEPISQYLTEETYPGSSVSTDDDWDAWLLNNFETEYHPSNTCVMLPKDKGGVVDPKLLVYGTSNVRIIDSSIVPIQFAAHLQIPVYGIAETGAEIVLAQYEKTSTSSSSSPSSTASGQQTDTNSGAGFSASPSVLITLGMGILISLLTL